MRFIRFFDTAMSSGATDPSSIPQADIWEGLHWWASAIFCLGWLAVWVYIASSRGFGLIPFFGMDAMLLFAWPIGSLGLALFCAFIAALAVRALFSRNYSRCRHLAAFLAPFAPAFLVLILLWSTELPMRARFELSQAQLSGVIDNYEANGDVGPGWAGFYAFDHVMRVDNCVVIVTGSFFLDEYGFARCNGPPSLQPHYIEFEHLTDDWYTYAHYD
jgi:hypothetical protein